jgi:hypothetical protein
MIACEPGLLTQKQYQAKEKAALLPYAKGREDEGDSAREPMEDLKRIQIVAHLSINNQSPLRLKNTEKE